MKPIQLIPATNSETFQLSVPSLKPPPANRLKSFDDNDFLDKPATKKSNVTPIKATSYSVGDLQMATGSFSIDNFMGEGSIGRVYRANFDDGKVCFS